MDEATRVADVVTRQMRHDARIIWGARIISDFAGYVRVLLIVTGLEGNSAVLPGFRGNIEIFDDVDWNALQLYRIDTPAGIVAQSSDSSQDGAHLVRNDRIITPQGAESDESNEQIIRPHPQTEIPPISINAGILTNEPLQGLGLKKIESASSASS